LTSRRDRLSSRSLCKPNAMVLGRKCGVSTERCMYLSSVVEIAWSLGVTRSHSPIKSLRAPCVRGAPVAEPRRQKRFLA
jgi:hypothetical protein